MKNKKLYISILIIIIITYISFYIYKWEFRNKNFEIYLFSLNRGRSIFIRTPENKTILIGGGQNTEIIREITKVTPFYKREINKLIIPSADIKQIGGLIEIINRYKIDEIIISKLIATSSILNELEKIIRKNKIHRIEVSEDDILEIENNLNIKVLFPNNNFKYNKTSLPELGLKFDYINTSVYLIGNLSKTIQKYIAKNLDIFDNNYSNVYSGSNSNKDGDSNSKSYKDNYNKEDNDNDSIIEFYNSAIESKVSKELLDKIKPKFIFSTKEKAMHLISNGEEWVQK